MGQSSSADSGWNAEVLYLQNKLSGQLSVLNRLAFFKHRELVEIVEELNSIMKNLIDRNEKQLCFAIRRGTDTTIFWKTTIRIRCLKLNTITKTIESSRLLTLRQFIIMHKEIKDQVAMLSVEADVEPVSSKVEHTDVSKDETFSASSFFASDDLCEDSVECCVCMERQASIMLSCAHEFCEICIDNWTKNMQQSTCPLCRSKVKGTDDAWVLTDKNEGSNYDTELKGYLVGLADRGDH